MVNQLCFYCMEKRFCNCINLTHMNRLVVTLETMDLQKEYDWPGNVRELGNFIERSLILSQTARFAGELHLDDSHLLNSTISSMSTDQLATHDSEILDLEEINQHHIVHSPVDKRKSARKKWCCCLLGINPGTLHSRMRKLKISFGKKRSGNFGRLIPLIHADGLFKFLEELILLFPIRSKALVKILAEFIKEI